MCLIYYECFHGHMCEGKRIGFLGQTYTHTYTRLNMIYVIIAHDLFQ